MQRRAERIDVAARIDHALVLLGRREAERPDHGALARLLNSRAMPKSTSTTRPFGVSITLDGFMSR